MASAPASSLRPLVVKQNGKEVIFSIPVDIWPVAEHAKEILATKTLAEDISDIELSLSVIEVALKLIDDEAIVGSLPFLATIFSQFQSRFLQSNGIHAAIRGVSAESRKTCIKTYYSAIATILKKSPADSFSSSDVITHESALFTAVAAGKASVFAIFGGQGNVGDYFDELLALYESYQPIAQSFVAQAAVTLDHHSTSEEARKAHATRIQVINWLQKPETRPSTDTLLITSLSLPLIGLTQLLNYWIMLKVLNKAPGDMHSFISGMIC